MGVRLNSDLKISSGPHQARLHGEDSELTMDFDSLSSLRHLHNQLPRPLPAGRLADSAFHPIRIAVRVREKLVATVTFENGRFTIRRHWLAILRCLLP